jgi:hypothetical protein
MPTWDETKEHLRIRFKLLREEPTWISMGWTFEGEDRVQEERIELRQALGEPHLMILCDVVGVDQMEPREALAHNITLAAGALALVDDRVVLRLVHPLEDLRFERLDRWLELVAHEAARLRRNKQQVYPGYVE